MKDKQLHIRITEKEHKLLRIICIHKGLTIQKLTHNLLKDFLTKNKSCLSTLSDKLKK